LQERARVIEGFKAQILNKLSAFEKVGNKWQPVAEGLRNKNMFNLVWNELRAMGEAGQAVTKRPNIGEVVNFTNKQGELLTGVIRAITGQRVEIDMAGKTVVAMLSQLSLPEIKPQGEGKGEVKFQGMTKEEWIADRLTKIDYIRAKKAESEIPKLVDKKKELLKELNIKQDVLSFSDKNKLQSELKTVSDKLRQAENYVAKVKNIGNLFDAGVEQSKLSQPQGEGKIELPEITIPKNANTQQLQISLREAVDKALEFSSKYKLPAEKEPLSFEVVYNTKGAIQPGGSAVKWNNQQLLDKIQEIKWALGDYNKAYFKLSQPQREGNNINQ